MSVAPEARSRLRRFLSWLGNQAGGAVVGLLVGAGLVGAWAAITSQPPLSEQLDELRSDEAARGFRVEMRVLDLRGVPESASSGDSAYLVVLQDESIGSPTSRLAT